MADIEKKLKTDFENIIKHGITLIDFNAPWCAPCRSQEPIIKKLEEKYRGRASIAEVNIDEHRELAARFGIQGIPTLVIFKNSKELQRFVGLQAESVLADALNNVMAQG
ncbi:MAG: thioredoxin family protein [Desulfobacterales bacterium]|nr:thioredoxin family protein [Desulfobacterales bacterium]